MKVESDSTAMHIAMHMTPHMLISGDLPDKPKRIVSMNPSATEFLFLVGAGDLVVGVDSWSYRPREALKKPRVGSFTTLNTDALKALKPDLAILYYPVQRGLVDAMGVPVVAVPTPTSIDGAVAVFRALGRLVDVDEEADRIAGIYRDLFREPHADVDGVLAAFWLGGIDVAGKMSFTADALEAVGARYVDLKGIFVFRKDEEEALPLLDSVDPALVVYESKVKAPDQREAGWIRRGKCRACREGAVVVTPNDTLAHYGPSLPLDMGPVAEALRSGSGVVGGTSSVMLPSLKDDFYRAYR